MPGPDPRLEPELLAAAQHGDSAAFDRLLAPHRRALYAHCYRMLGSLQDAEDALQEALLGAWKGLAPFAGRSSLRSWLYKITTHACLRLLAQRPRRILSPEHGPARSDVFELGQPVVDPIWLEPWVDSEPAVWSAAVVCVPVSGGPPRVQPRGLWINHRGSREPSQAIPQRIYISTMESLATCGQ